MNEKTDRTTPQKRRALIVGSLFVIALLAGAVIWWHLRPTPTAISPKTDTKAIMQSEIRQAATSNNMPTPLHYPSKLPGGFRYVQDSVAVFEGQAVNFSIQSEDGRTITITEQPRPRLIEEVKKTREFKTPVGSGYIADLEGRTVGFLLTDKTLIIASPVAEKKIDDRILSDVLASMTIL